ncbi:hypothetical protein U1Q18_026838 [Sarracenia purpurea var. burkii]
MLVTVFEMHLLDYCRVEDAIEILEYVLKLRKEALKAPMRGHGRTQDSKTREKCPHTAKGETMTRKKTSSNSGLNVAEIVMKAAVLVQSAEFLWVSRQLCCLELIGAGFGALCCCICSYAIWFPNSCLAVLGFPNLLSG